MGAFFLWLAIGLVVGFAAAFSVGWLLMQRELRSHELRWRVEDYTDPRKPW